MDWLSPIRVLFEFALPLLESVPIIRAILGFALVFFLPGFAWTLVFFNNRQLNIVERVALSIGLSIPIVTLSIIVLNKLAGISINGLNSFLIIMVITIIPVAYYYLNRFWRQRLGGKRGKT